jgi:hypothetical protein
VPRRVCGSKGDEVTGDWRKLLNEQLLNLYSSPNIIKMIKPRRMRWARTNGREKELIYDIGVKARRKETNH